MTSKPGVAVGVDVGGTKVLAVALADESTEIVGECRRPTPSAGEKELIEVIVETATAAAKGAGAPLRAVAVGVPGLVDRDGVMRFAANLPGVVEVPLGARLSDRLGVPALIDNDANLAAWGERVAGAGNGADDMLMVTIGTGIGGGIVLGGQLYRGAHGMAGEIGHIVVQFDGEPCECGQRGCWERYASGTALGRIAREARFIDGEAAMARAAAGDAEALLVVDTFARWMAIGIAGLVNVLDPTVVVLGGGLVEARDLLLTPLRDWLGRLIEGAAHRPPVALVPASLGERAGAIGAALLARGASER